MRLSGVMPLNQRISVQTEHKAIPRLNQNGQTPEPGPRSGTQPITSPSPCIFHIIPSEKTNIPIAINSSAFRVDIAFSINKLNEAITSSTRATVGVTKAEKSGVRVPSATSALGFFYSPVIALAPTCAINFSCALYWSVWNLPRSAPAIILSHVSPSLVQKSCHSFESNSSWNRFV